MDFLLVGCLKADFSICVQICNHSWTERCISINTHTVEGSAERVHSTTSGICIFPLQSKPAVCSLSSQTHHLPTLCTASDSDLPPVLRVLRVLRVLGALRSLPSISNLHFVHQAAASSPVLLWRRIKKKTPPDLESCRELNSN